VIALLSFLVILSLSILVTKVATAALIHTGLSQEAARFQARSAFTGVGFTTKESEQVVGHPVRRRILMLLMLLGNAGMVSAVSTLILTFVDVRASSLGWYLRIGIILAGSVTLWYLATSKAVDRWLKQLIGWALKRWTRLDVRDYAGLLHLSGDYEVKELMVEEDDWLAGKTLFELKLTREGMLVLAIQREEGRFVGAPTRDTRVEEHDLLIVYGRAPAMEKLDERRKGFHGDIEHARAVSEHEKVVEDQEKEEKQARKRKEMEKSIQEGETEP
jgi:hypothetical protein